MILCVLFAGISLHYGLRLYGHWREYNAGAQVYQELTQYIQPIAPPASPAKPQAVPVSHTPETEETVPPEAVDDTVWPTVDFESLQAINPDVVAWISIEGTNIDYPVVQGTDNNYYLNRLFDGRENGAGSIFMDYRNTPDIMGKNTVLYGHNLKNSTMFSQITNYKEQSFYDQHPTALLITPERNYKIQFVAGYVTDPNGPAWKMEFASDEEFFLWLENAIAQSTFQSTVQVTPQDRVITFSTCSHEYREARYVLIGILK